MAQERVNIIITESGTRVVQRRIAGIGTSAKASAGAVRTLRTAVLGLGGIALLANTVRTIASFEQALSTVKAVSGATESQFASLRDTAAELGKTTRFTATQAAEGMIELARAGFEVSENLEAVDDTLLLAQAGALDLRRAAELTAGALRGFGLQADQAQRVTDVYAYAANNAAMDVNQLGEAMKFVAPAARGLNVTLEESVAALQALADSQLKGSLGGTGLRQVMIELESPSSKTRKILQKVGLSVDQVRVSSVGLTKALGNMRDAGVTTGQAYEIFGRRGGGAASVLLRSVPIIQQNNEELLNAGGAAREVARIMDDNLNGALLRVKSAFEAVQLQFGQLGASSFLVSFMNRLAGALRFLADNVEILDGALAALAFTSIPKLISVFAALTPFLSLVAIGAGIGALVAFRDEIKLTQDSATTLGDLGSAAMERIRESGNIVVEFFRTKFSELPEAFGEVEFSVEGLVRFTAIALDRFIGFWRAAINAIVELFKNLGPALVDIMTDVLNGVLSTLDAGLRKFYSLLGKIPGRAGAPYRRLAEDGIIPAITNAAEGGAELLAQSVKDGFAKGFDEITVFEDAVDGLFERADQIAQKRLAKEATGSDVQAIVDATGGAPTPDDGDPTQVMDRFSAGVSSGFEQIGELVHNFGSQVEATMVNAFTGAEDAVVDFVTTGKANFSDLVDSILGDLTRLLVRQGLSMLLNSLSGGTSGAASSLFNIAGARADGGSVTAGKNYLVGERGPEIYTPSMPGMITPSGEAPAQQGEESSGITIINVSSMEEALAAMQSVRGQRIIVNTMDEKNRQVR